MPNISGSSETGLTLVTGATGFVGSGVVARLAAHGVETLACVRGAMVSMPVGVRVVSLGELNANTDWRQVLVGVKNVVQQDAYGHSKHEAEQGLRQLSADTGMEVVIIRPPLVYGPGVKANFAALMRAVHRGWPLPLGAVHNRRSLVALDNLVDFIVTCITHPQAANQTFLVSDGQDLSTTELVSGMAQAAGVPARLLPVPVWALQMGGSLLGKGDAVQRLCGNLQVDISKARSLLGWVPPVTVEEGLRRAMAV